MASLTDLLNPTFLMFLGIVVLVVALLVVYFESKFREQNHTIASMLSLVSSLAEELNGTKIAIHHLSMRQQPQQQGQGQQSFSNLDENITISKNSNANKLIHVSDDEDSDNDSDSGSDSDSEESLQEINDDDDSESDNSQSDNSQSDNSVIEIGEHNDIKILKLNISDQNDDDNEYHKSNNLVFDDLNENELDDLDELDNLSINSTNINDIDDNNHKTDELNIKSMDLKSININLEESKTENVDYKKMTLPKLRSIVVEKGLVEDSSKLKKIELLKLLEID